MAKNTHLEHLEDDLINQGYQGGLNAINFIESLSDMLDSGGKGARVTVKWDGAPAIVCGRTPQGQFFVGTKSVFNKGQPKIGYDHDLIDYHYEGSVVGTILHEVYDQLKKLPFKGVLQGDLLYTKTPPITKMGGNTVYKFRPNTITYAVDAYSELGQKIGASKLGIVFHTSYTGESVENMSASFGVDVSHLQGVKDVAVLSSNFENVGGVATLSTTEKVQVKQNIRNAKIGMTKGRSFLDLLGGTRPFEYTALFKVYFNQVIRTGKVPKTAALMHKGFEVFVSQRFDMEIAKKKTEKSKEQWKKKKQDSLKYLNSNKTAIHNAMSAFQSLITAKKIIIRRLEKVKGIGTFIEDESGYRVTSPEGYVAIKNGTAIILVDRLEFSKANVTVAKNWSK